MDNLQSAKAIDIFLANEKKKDKKRRARLEKRRREIRKIGQRVKNPDLYDL